uniref:Mediator of RNA polymerase II transcription subunit 24 n=1 Tax=Toxocara canis TaxID=6265 RepID=A0A183TZJ3_TOXCA
LMLYSAELFQMLAQTCSPLAQPSVHQPLILRANSAKMAVDKMLRQTNNAVINVLLKLASGSGGLFTFDSVCASFCADGNLTYFSSKLAMINGQSERPPEGMDMDDGRQRALAFNLSFILLTRMRFIYNDLRPSELVNGSGRGMDNTQSCFFKFASQYGWTAADSTTPMNPLSDEEKAPFIERVNLLKHAQPFWDPRTVDYAELVDSVPYIGEILLDDFKIKKHETYDHLNENIKNVLHAFRDDANFMIVCLVQWICAQRVCDERQSLVKSFIHALEFPHQLNPTQQERMALTSAACRRTLDDLSICDRLRDPRFTWIINCAKRKLPTVPFTLPATNAQSSDAEMLKQAFTYARQQAWGSPNVLQLVDRCNKAGVVENWCMVWLSSMLKLSTNDEMVAAGELCLAAGVMSPVPCMLSFARSITEYILERNVDFGCVEPKALVSARFLVHCLQLALHAYWRQQKEKLAKPLKSEEIERRRIKTEEDDEEMDEGNPVERSIQVIFEKFLRETRAGHLKVLSMLKNYVEHSKVFLTLWLLE